LVEEGNNEKKAFKTPFLGRYSYDKRFNSKKKKYRKGKKV
jgi:hypothetical protein